MVEGGSLENCYTRKGIVSSNLTSSAFDLEIVLWYNVVRIEGVSFWFRIQEGIMGKIFKAMLTGSTPIFIIVGLMLLSSNGQVILNDLAQQIGQSLIGMAVSLMNGIAQALRGLAPDAAVVWIIIIGFCVMCGKK